MRSIGSLQSQLAKRFVDFLTVKSIGAKAEEDEDDQSIIWIRNEDQLEQAKEELNRYLKNPSAEVYQIAEGQAKQFEKEREAKRDRIAKLAQDANRPAPFFAKTPMVLLLLIICSVIFLIGGSMDNFGTIDSGYYFCSISPDRVPGLNTFLSHQANGEESLAESIWFKSASIRSGEFWRVFTPMFLHGDLIHILFNMFWLVYFGRRIERIEGTTFFFLLVMVSAMVASSFQDLMPFRYNGTPLVGPDPIGDSSYLAVYTPSGGFSGVGYGLFGYIWMRSTWTRVNEYYLSPTMIMFFMAWMMFGIIGIDRMFLSTSMADWAHAMGLVSGVVIGALPFGKSKKIQ